MSIKPKYFAWNHWNIVQIIFRSFMWWDSYDLITRLIWFKIGWIIILWALFMFFFSGNLRAVNRGKTTFLKQSLSSLFQLYIFANCILYLRKHVNCKYGSQYNFSNVSKYTLLAVEYHIVKSKNLTCVLLISTNILSGPFNILSKFSGAI